MTELATRGGVTEDHYLTRRTALYSLYGSADNLLYVGIGFDPEIRWSQHAREKEWWPYVVRKDVVWFESRLAAMDAEDEAIRIKAPRYNVAGKPGPPPPQRRDVPSGTGSVAQRIAAELRERISRGELAPGECVPSEAAICQEFDVSRQTARAAVRVLRDEGLAELVFGKGVVVREQPEVEEITAEPGSTVSSRPPTPEERRELDVPEGWPVLQVVHPDGSGDVYPAHRFRVVTS